MELTQTVCEVLREISVGHVATYGDVGRQVGISPRQAGREVGKVPDDVPWWRVVRADGRTATCRAGQAAALLGEEGVAVHEGRVDLGRVRHSWSPD